MPTAPITEFRGDYRFLSNFYPCRIVWAHTPYRSVEHAYQAAKTLDPVERKIIRDAISPKTAKALGQSVTLRKDWNKIRVEFMERMLRQKFSTGELCRQLCDTKDAPLIEGNYWHDTFWGQCVCSEHQHQGENHLGKLLMLIRSDLLLDL